MASSAPVFRRSVSLPTRAASVPDQQVDVLYHLPSVRIVAFTTPSSIYQAGSSNGGSTLEATPGTLPWASAFERTLAVGPLRLYRAPGSVAFLNCANALQPILPKSQCWCVSTSEDRDCKFVLQIRRPNFWRIEVPIKDIEERNRVDEFKAALSKVLLFEKTHCPFERTFSVDLPEAPQTPVKKRPWKPVKKQSTGMLPFPDSAPPGDRYRQTMTTASPAERITTPAVEHVTELSLGECSTPNSKINLPMAIRPANLDKELSSPFLYKNSPIQDEINTHQEASSKAIPVEAPENTTMLRSDLGPREEETDNFSDATDDTNITPKSLFQPKYQPLKFDTDLHDRPHAMQNCKRSITAPPILSLVTSPPSKHGTKSPLGPRSSTIHESDSDPSSSVDSFHSILSWHSPLDPPSPTYSNPSSPKTYPYPHDDIVLPRALHSRGASELTVVPHSPETPGAWKAPGIESWCPSTPPKTPILIKDTSDDEHDCSEAITPPTVRQNFRHRATTSSNSRRRALSPLPPAANLFVPPKSRSRRLQTARHLPTAIIQTTCKILLSPPSHLFDLMVSIASKIAAGEWRGFLSNRGQNVSWDFEQEYMADISNEDDYGIISPTKHRPSSRKVASSSADSGGSWEVD